MQVYERIKAPLLTLMSSSSSEQAYAVLCHLNLLVQRAPMLFAGDYKHFYCRHSDPTYVKKLKLEMLTAVANENNMYDIGEDSLVLRLPPSPTPHATALKLRHRWKASPSFSRITPIIAQPLIAECESQNAACSQPNKWPLCYPFGVQ